MDLHPLHSPSLAVGTRIKALRARLGLSQSRLAELARLHPSNLGRLERGTSNPNLDTLVRVATALGTTVSELTRSIATRAHEQPAPAPGPLLPREPRHWTHDEWDA